MPSALGLPLAAAAPKVPFEASPTSSSFLPVASFPGGWPGTKSWLHLAFPPLSLSPLSPVSFFSPPLPIAQFLLSHLILPGWYGTIYLWLLSNKQQWNKRVDKFL